MTRYEAVYNLLADLDDEDLIEMYNNFAKKKNWEQIYPMDMFYPDLYSGEGRTPFEIISDLKYVNEEDKYVSEHDVYGWESFNWYSVSPNKLSYKEMAECITENNDDLGNSEVSVIFDMETVEDVLRDYDDDQLVKFDWDDKLYPVSELANELEHLVIGYKKADGIVYITTL